MQDDNDLQLVDDFMGLGRDQILFVNSVNSNDGRLMIADFSSGKPPAQVMDWEDWGESYT